MMRSCPLIASSPTWEMCARQLASWAQIDNEPLRPQLLRELRRLGIADEFVRTVPHTFITVILPKGTAIQSALDMTSSMSYKWFDEAKCVLEGWPADNPHLHLITKGKPKKQNVIRCFSARFNVAPQKVDVKFSDDGQLFAKRNSEYILGKKQSDKMSAVDDDRQYRDDHHIPHLIEFFS